MGLDVTLVNNFKKVSDLIDKTSKDRMVQSCVAVRNEAVDLLTGPRSGLWYYVTSGVKSKRRRKYQASAPGEPPAVVTGILRKSVTWETQNEGIGIVGYVGSEEGRAGTSTKYAKWLEFGTSKMKPRPWLRPAFEKAQVAVKEIMTRTWF
jgi:HK97 gp10 family phage protein